MGRLAIIVTVTAWLAYLINWFLNDFFHPGNEGAAARTEEVLYLLIVTLLTVSALAYLLSRLGFDPDLPKTATARQQLQAARALPGKVERLLAEPAHRFAAGLRAFEAAMERGEQPSAGSMATLAGVAWTFTADVASFERKQYVSLSDEPNKAMNLNSYIGLMGGSYQEIATVGGTALVQVPSGAGLHIPNPEYVVTLDADSVLLPEYCLRLVHLLEQQEYQDMAIAQTPYSAFPGSATRLERIAGASTDLQHIVHQGLTYYDATFWVGANAVIRKRALDDIAEISYLGDWEIKRYIKDRTVIEDTESTIDMGIHGWRLYKLPGAAQLQRHPAGLRLAVHPAPSLGRRRPADRVQAAPPITRPPLPRPADPVQRTVPAVELHGLHLLELGPWGLSPPASKTSHAKLGPSAALMRAEG
jgi:hypothetical protein